MHRHLWTFMILPARLILLLSFSTVTLTASPVVSGQVNEDVPFDLAALVLHSDDLTWLLASQGLPHD